LVTVVVSHLDADASHERASRVEPPRSFKRIDACDFIPADWSNRLDAGRNIGSLEQTLVGCHLEVFVEEGDSEAV